MLNKKELEKQGYTFVKIEGVEFLDISTPVEKKVIKCPTVVAEQAMRNLFFKTSQERGKALSILLPLFDQEKMTDLLSELYDLREESIQRKIKDQMAEKKIEEVMDQVGVVLNHPDVVKKLNSFVDSKCRPKKPISKTTQKKKVPKKK